MPFAESSLASVSWLEAAYLKDANPVHVWTAIKQIQFASPILGRQFDFPPWVLAYLFAAANMIAGAAVTTPAGDQRQPPAPIKKLGGNFSSWFAGLTAEQRTAMAMEALGFRGRHNPLAQAHRDYKALQRLREEKLLRKKGLSKKAAAEEIVKHADDPARKMRRDRRRLGGET